MGCEGLSCVLIHRIFHSLDQEADGVDGVDGVDGRGRQFGNFLGITAGYVD